MTLILQKATPGKSAGADDHPAEGGQHKRRSECLCGKRITKREGSHAQMGTQQSVSYITKCFTVSSLIVHILDYLLQGI